MNNAADNKKLGLLAALVTRMAEQRIAMNAIMATMSEKEMKHMTQHMQIGKDSMQGCAMMMGIDANDMKGMDKKTEEPEKKAKSITDKHNPAAQNRWVMGNPEPVIRG